MNPAIRFFHGHDLGGLADALACELVRAPLPDPLASEVILVPHPGMGRWLQQRFAQRFGIAACLDLALPARFVWQTLVALDPQLPEQSGYERDALRWRIHGLIEKLAGTRGFEPINRYLGDRSDPERAFELADRLGDAFDQYLVYRPDWLDTWEQGRLVGLANPHEAWQAALWRAVRESVAQPHRAELIRRYGALLANDEPLPDGIELPSRIAVFGLSTLPPIHLRFLSALANRVPVTWFHLDPSDEWWGDVQTGRERRRAEARFARDGVPDAERHLESPHPLLESFGRIGRDFVRQLYDVFEFDDEHVTSEEPDSLLGHVRQTLAALKTDIAPPAVEGDDSIRVYGCLDPLREVETLHDALLARFEADPTLTPRDIVVMTPRYADYAPLIEAVFGAAPESRRIPYTLADRTAAMHPLVHAYVRLLALPQSRLAASEVLDLLRVPAIGQRFGIDAEDHSRIVRWVEATKIRWGIDASDRTRLGLGSFEEFSWTAGLDRVLVGYAAGDDAQLVGGVLPYDELEGQGARAAGAALRFVERLADWRTRLEATRRASAWQDTLLALLDECFDEGADDDERRARRAVRESTEALHRALDRGGRSGDPIASAVLRAALTAQLEEPERRQRFLATGVTVCAMVPMRNVPFRVVCLLGLDEGAFPRREPEASFQLMRAAPRDGDRSRADDDRYLFLEALLAARSHLHISHGAVNPKDGSSRPPSVVVEELLAFVESCQPKERRESVRKALYRRVPDQPYDPLLFRPNELRSFDTTWEDSARALERPRAVPPPFATYAVESSVEFEDEAVAAAAPPVIVLEDLLGFYRNPPKDYGRRVLKLVLDESSLPEDDEPFVLNGLDGYQLSDHLLARWSADRNIADRTLLLESRAAGLLRPGFAGLRDFQAHARAVRSLLEHVGELPAPTAVAIDREGGGAVVRGAATVHGDRLVVMRAAKLRGVDWLRGAIAGSLLGRDRVLGFGLVKGQRVEGVLDLTQLPAEWLARVVGIYRRSREGFVPLLAKSSWDAVHQKSGESAALSCFNGQKHDNAPPGERTEPYVALAWRGRQPPLDEAFFAFAELVFRPIEDALSLAGDAEDDA